MIEALLTFALSSVFTAIALAPLFTRKRRGFNRGRLV
jgi:hypothetical protein